MKMRYQRDLYRVQLCSDTNREEVDFGYPLQMCLRNSVPGLLPCHGQNDDGKFSICWDVTSRYAVTQIVGEGQISPALLQQVLKSLLVVMESMERYLIPCEYLALEPECIFLAAEDGMVSFLCDFENRDSFRSTVLVLGEYVLEHMDHKNSAAMGLGYGLYRLAVEDSFDREKLKKLVEDTLPGTGPSEEKSFRDGEARPLRPEERPMGYVADGISGLRMEGTSEQQARREALQSFFETEKEISGSALPVKKTVLLCATMVMAGTLIMEGVLYFRNGCHLDPVWLGIGAALIALSAAILAVPGIISRLAGQTKLQKEGKMKRQPQEKPLPEDIYLQKNPTERTDFAAADPEKSEELSGATVVLNRRQLSKESSTPVLRCDDGREFRLNGEQWLIGKKKSQVDICLERDTVSRLHGRIYCRDGTYYIEDLNSRNGTFLNGRMLEGGRPEMLTDGAEILFADLRCAFFLSKGQDSGNRMSKNTVIYEV